MYVDRSGSALSGDRASEGIAGLGATGGRLRRRELLQAGAGAAVALGLSACGIGRGLQGEPHPVQLARFLPTAWPHQ